ncbi:hypothetical protein GCM10011378_37610 [Hymenobacter glacieicola]|uniref:Uncharacterized protein n=1 Tax=Hymenobacter glacieicola TaxID=1562124 RepID=A0ABQ1X658_9BACT|nr:hypothetical protein GCM10011378_37610 [Hymenobacter glacieicola]
MVARIEGGLENLDPLAGNLGPVQPPDQLLSLAGKHGAAHNFNPAPAGNITAGTDAGFDKHRRVGKKVSKYGADQPVGKRSTEITSLLPDTSNRPGKLLPRWPASAYSFVMLNSSASAL